MYLLFLLYQNPEQVASTIPEIQEALVQKQSRLLSFFLRLFEGYSNLQASDILL